MPLLPSYPGSLLPTPLGAAIDFYCTVDKVTGKQGEARVVITFNGKVRGVAMLACRAELGQCLGEAEGFDGSSSSSRS
jgi:hypothetical protein